MGWKSYQESVRKSLSPTPPPSAIEKVADSAMEKSALLRKFMFEDDADQKSRPPADSSGVLSLEKSIGSPPTKRSLTSEVRWAKQGAGRSVPRQSKGDELSPEVLLLMYKMNPAVRIAVDTIVDIVSSTKWTISPINVNKTISESMQKDIDRVKMFFTRPNSSDSFRRLMRKWVKDLVLYDAGVFEKGRDESTGDFTDLYVAWGGTISINCWPNGVTKEYFQVIQGTSTTRVTWDPQDMIYSMLYPSSDRVYGISKLETLHNTITAYLFAEQRNISFFENDARPSGIVNLGPGISEHQLQRFRDYWLAEHQGTPHKILVTGGAAAETKWVPISQSAKDMDFMNYLNWIFKLILVTLGISPSQVGWSEGGERVSSSAAALQSQAFRVRTIFPILQELQFVLTEQIIRDEFQIDDLMFKFVEESSLQEKLQKATYFRTMLESKQMTVDEVRKEEGRGPYTEEEKKELLTPTYPQPPMPLGGAPGMPGMPPGMPGAPGEPGGAPGTPGEEGKQPATKEDLKKAFDDLKETLEDVTGTDLTGLR